MAKQCEELHRKIHRGDPEFEKMYQNETKWIKKRREEAEVRDIGDDRIGLALSGGGIRSATFNLGVIQGLTRAGIMKYVDYLSTVSGGGYIGSCYTWLMAKKKEKFEGLKDEYQWVKHDLKGYPFGIRSEDHDRLGGTVLAWLRSHGNYLTPGEGLNVWALASAVLTGILVNLLVMVPVFLLLFFGLSRKVTLMNGMPEFLKPLLNSGNNSVLVYFFIFGLAFLALWFVVSILLTIFAGIIRSLRKSSVQRWLRIATGTIIKLGAVFIVAGTIPLLHAYINVHLAGWIEAAMSGISLSGILSMAGGSFKKEKGNETKGGRSILLSIGLLLLVYGLFIWFYHISLIHSNLTWLIPGAVLSLVLALLANINHVSMHRFYRNRLMQAYMPDELTVSGHEETDDREQCVHEKIDIGNPDKFCFTDLKKAETAAPYHIVNTNVVTVGSEDYRLSARGGDNFIFSPHYSGSDATKFIKTEDYVGGYMNLATAFSISGAAVNPNSYATRSRPLSFLMTLLNIRLGYWIQNPRYSKKKWWEGKPKGLYLRPMWYVYMFAEMFGSGLKETHKQIHLSDGGHFENLALYELIRRKCKYIVVCDAGADKDFSFGDLSKLIQLVRLDFGARIELDNSHDLVPDEKTGFAESPFVHGTINYGEGPDGKDITGEIIYIKTTVVDDLNEDIYAYRREHPDFPDESTADQFFNETQFEAYRELGFHTGETLGKHFDEKKIPDFFKGKWHQKKKPTKKSKPAPPKKEE